MRNHEKRLKSQFRRCGEVFSGAMEKLKQNKAPSSRMGLCFYGTNHGGRLVVVLKPKVRDESLAHDVAQGVLELHGLDKQVVLRVEPLGGLR